jgi:hypothetical protein
VSPVVDIEGDHRVVKGDIAGTKDEDEGLDVRKENSQRDLMFPYGIVGREATKYVWGCCA